MKSDPGLLLVASLGAALLAAGGAYLRAAFGRKNDHTGEAKMLRTRLDAAARELAAIRAELSEANSTREAQRLEIVEQRQRGERQAQASQAEVERLIAEMEQLKRKRTTLVESKRPSGRPGEVAELERKVKAATEESEAARAKVAALERLVEGVRARSRELAEELKALKGQ